ncbi:SpoIIE family protein phosphatase [Streptomyces sp. NPDC017988]|uniref:SpoIIE family protein phosphatase n=1 Tax=Streptomyces sp. NPDC017988 TaxID=3365025 RepID=UPI0037AFA443
MDSSDAPGARSRRFPPTPRSVASARRFVGTALEGAPSELVDTARLLVGELVTNAVLHARTEVEVAVLPRGGGALVKVSDLCPARGLVPLGGRPYAGTGQGLRIVEELATRYGVDADGQRKTAWFELLPDGRGGPRGPEGPDGAGGAGGVPSSSSGWKAGAPPADPCNPRNPCNSCTTVDLVDMPRDLCAASEQHRHALLRELALAMEGRDDPEVRPTDLATAQDTNNLVSACLRAALEEHHPQTNILSLTLTVPADAAPAVNTLRRVLAVAEEAAREEQLLTLPSLPLNRLFRKWVLEQIIGQLDGGSAAPWTLLMVPPEPGLSTSELVPWDVGHLRTSRVPTIAADETNRIVAANGPAADLLGWDADALIGQKLTVLIPEHLRERHLSAFTSLLLTGEARILGRSVPLPAQHQDGHLVPVRLVIRTQELTDGRTVFVAHLVPRGAAPADSGRNRLTVAQELPAGPQPPTAPERDRLRSGTRTDMSPLERLTLLADTGSALSNTLHLGAGLQRAGQVMTERLADWCTVDLFDDEARVDRVCVAHRDPPPGLLPEAYEGRLPPLTEGARGPLARVLRGAGPLLLTEVPPPSPDGNPLDAQYAELFERMGATSAIVAPLRARREIFGALTVARTSGSRPFTQEDLSLVDDLVRTLALGVDSARLYQDTRNVAERLQRALLAKLPEVEHLPMAARYAPSSTTAQVGGDWYDSFVVAHGTALVIGDVTGHNLDAAIAMSQLRSMLRGIAIDRQEPPEAVLRRLDLANHSLYKEATATCFYGLIKGPAEGPWQLHYSSAGHPPPLLTTAEGGTRFLEEGAGLLLGVDPDMPRPDATVELPAHSTLLLYTDGPIERRDETLDDSMARLAEHTAALAGEPLDVFCDELLIRLGADSPDDLAILAVRLTPR